MYTHLNLDAYGKAIHALKECGVELRTELEQPDNLALSTGLDLDSGFTAGEEFWINHVKPGKSYLDITRTFHEKGARGISVGRSTNWILSRIAKASRIAGADSDIIWELDEVAYRALVHDIETNGAIVFFGDLVMGFVDVNGDFAKIPEAHRPKHWAMHLMLTVVDGKLRLGGYYVAHPKGWPLRFRAAALVRAA